MSRTGQILQSSEEGLSKPMSGTTTSALSDGASSGSLAPWTSKPKLQVFGEDSLVQASSVQEPSFAPCIEKETSIPVRRKFDVFDDIFELQAPFRAEVSHPIFGFSFHPFSAHFHSLSRERAPSFSHTRRHNLADCLSRLGSRFRSPNTDLERATPS